MIDEIDIPLPRLAKINRERPNLPISKNERLSLQIPQQLKGQEENNA